MSISADKRLKPVRRSRSKKTTASCPKKKPREKKSPFEQHTVEITLRTNAREQRILDQKFQAHGKVINATLGTMLNRVDQMRRDSRWAVAGLLEDGSVEKREAYNALKKQYRVSSYAAIEVTFKHWQASEWMGRVMGNTIARAAGQEVWTQVSAWLYQTRAGTGRPGFKPSADSNIMHGSRNQDVLYLKTIKDKRTGKQQAVVRMYCSTKRKILLLPLPADWQVGSLNWERKLAGPLMNKTIKRVSLKREVIRGKTRYSALFAIEGLPYRNPDYLEQTLTVHGKHVGLDVGPSLLAVVGEKESLLLNLYPMELASQRKEEARKSRRYQRFLDRSARALNPEAFDKRGRSIKGVRQSVKSTKSKRVRAKLTESNRKQAIYRQQSHVAVARTVARTVGTVFASEKNNYSAWPGSRYGRRMSETAPSMLMGCLHREGLLLHAIHESAGYKPADGIIASTGSFEFATSASLAPSQHCLCGNKVKKDLSNRYHACKNCGIGLPSPRTDLPITDVSHRLDRDLMSALIARLVSEHHVNDSLGSKTTNNNLSGNLFSLSNGPFAHLVHGDGNRTKTHELTSSRVAVATPSLHSVQVQSPVSAGFAAVNTTKHDNGLVVAGAPSGSPETFNQTPGQHEPPPQSQQGSHINGDSVIGRARTSQQAVELSSEPQDAPAVKRLPKHHTEF